MASESEIELEFTEDLQLTEVMRLRFQSLQQRGQKRQEGERLLLPHEAVFRLDFTDQELTFSHWKVTLTGAGRLSITGISQLWTPDLTNLMTRQLLEPTGQFWRSAGDPEDASIKCLEADIQEFGERIAELAKVRKVMYFLFAFKEGVEKDGVKWSDDEASVFQLIPKVFSLVQVKALCRKLEFLNTNFGKSRLNEPRFVHGSIVMLKQLEQDCTFLRLPHGLFSKTPERNF
ncbi:hypothetical protein QTP86_002660 [Hemibagrus guttatus]|nr:hypothetical protein QTP86_002660 [Hemibagrus guttatus]